MVLSSFSRHFVVWLVFFAVLSAAFSSIFACATPFIAFIAFAALTLPKPHAQALILAVWAVNQVMGYGLLAYPVTLNSMAWGAILLTTSMVALLATQALLASRGFSSAGLRHLAAFACAFTVQQVLLYAVTFTPLGGAEGNTLEVVLQVLKTDAFAFVLLIAVSLVAHKFGHGIQAPNTSSIAK